MKKTLLYLVLFIASATVSFAQLNGTYTIGGSTPDYQTINDAVSALNTDGISGPVTFNIRTGTYNEQIEIGTISGVSSSSRITFQSETNSSNDVIISYSPTSSTDNYTIELDAAEYITFQFLTIESSGTSGYNHVVKMINGSISIQFIFNKILGLSEDGATMDSKVSFYANSSSEDIGLYIFHNTFIGSDFKFVYIYQANNLTFRGNTLMEGLTSGDRTVAFYNINGSCNISRNEFVSTVQVYSTTDGTNNDISLNANIFHLLLWAEIFGTDIHPALIQNNIFLNQVYISDGDYYNIFHNTFYSLNTSQSSLWIQTDPTNISLKNNNFIKAGSQRIIQIDNLSSIISMDYNNYYNQGATLIYTTESYTNLEDWQNASSFDMHSFNIEPNFIDAENNDFRLCQVNAELIGEGGLVDLDYNNTTRDAISPIIGAYENQNTFLSEPYLGEDQSFCENATLDITAGTYSSYLWANGEDTETLNINTNSSENYSIVVTDVTGCQFSDDINITVNPLPNVNLGEDQTACDGETETIDAGVFDNYIWNTGESTSTIDVTATGDYSVEVIDANTCHNSDTIHIEFQDCTNINNINNTNSVSIYPNPAHNHLQILPNNKQLGENIEIFDITGKVIFTKIWQGSKGSIDISFLRNGIYYIKIGNSATKFIKE